MKLKIRMIQKIKEYANTIVVMILLGLSIKVICFW